MSARVPKPNRILSTLVCAAVAVLASMFGQWDTASAHNSLAVSEPADGEVLDTSPGTWTLTFTGVVPLESASAEIVFADGSRVALSSPVHGESTNTIVFALPESMSGDVTGRWRLVGTDGHVITGRVQFAVAPAPAVVTEDSVPGSGATPDSTPAADPTVDDVVVDPGSDLDEPASTEPLFVDPVSEQARWVLHILSYLGLIAVGGLVFADMVLARGILRRPRATLALQGGALVLFVAPALMSLIHISDIEGVRLTEAFSFLGSLLDTTAGSMLALRGAIGFVLLMVTLTLDQRPLESKFVRGLAGLVALYIVSVPFVGHSRSMRWPGLGVPAGIVHLAGVTVWIGGLVALVAFVMPAAQTGSAVLAYVRFSRHAAWAVVAIVVTGVIQSLRLHDAPLSLLDSTHGLLLAVKVVLVAVMLFVGWGVRRLLAQEDGSSDVELRSRLIRVTGLETALGILVVGVSAALVRATFDV